jgi:hypothetical protein
MLAKYAKKGKRVLDFLLLPLIIILVAIGAFGLGRLSVLEAQKPHLVIHPPSSNSGEASPPASNYPSATSTLQ